VTETLDEATLAALDPSDPRLYFNRELSLLQFHSRVLELAEDPNIPLLERLNFLCISSTNLDEFFEVRVASLKQQEMLGVDKPSIDGRTAGEQIAAIGTYAGELVRNQYRILNDEIIPELAEHGIRFIRRSHWDAEQTAWIADYFERMLVPVMSPLGLDPAHPFPRILNKSLNFVVTLEGRDAFGRAGGVAIVPAPRALSRLIQFPPEISAGSKDFVFLSSIIHAHVGKLFPGMTVTGCYQFRVTRNSDLFVDEEEIDDLLRALEGELPSRNYGQAVRLEVADNCPRPVYQFLLRKFDLTEQDLYQVNGPVNLNRLSAIREIAGQTELRYRPFSPGLPPSVRHHEDIFKAITEAGSILCHHPYQSFVPILDFIRQSAGDPEVLAIKQTLYRTGTDSQIVEALIEAAQSGKEVTVVVELKARFDEAANIHLATRLQDAGAHVVYGVVGYKTHAKMALAVRREQGGLRRYVHLGTGNYHAGTARAYTDIGLLTDDPELADDVHQLFQQLTGLGQVKILHKILQSPFTLHAAMIEAIERETRHAEAGRTGRIIAKMNALIEPRIIQALYRASRAGVEIDLIVRGICCLRPGLPGVSDHIRVRSMLGRFLEHSRIFYFYNDGRKDVYCSSADWMPRNFFRRVETCFPIQDPELRERIVSQDLELHLQDTTNAWVLDGNGHYRRRHPTDDEPARTAQEVLMQELTGDR